MSYPYNPYISYPQYGQDLQQRQMNNLSTMPNPYQPRFSSPDMQYNQAQTPKQMMKLIPVTSFDEAKAAMIDFDGCLNVFVNMQNGEIYTRQWSVNGTATPIIYRKVESEPAIPQNVNQPQRTESFVSKEQFNALFARVENLEKSLGGVPDVSNVSPATNANS